MATISYSFKSSGGSANWSAWTLTPTSPATMTLASSIPQTTLPTNNKNTTASNSNLTLAGTWTALFGVPIGATITGVTSASAQSKCTTIVGAGSTHQANASTLVDGATTITLSAVRSFTATDAAFVSSSGTNATGLSLAASDSVTLTVGNSLSNGSSNSDTTVLQQDSLAFTITYTPANHTTTGALVGKGAVIVGSAVNHVKHVTSGVLVGQGSTIVGTAHHAAKHTSTGVLVGPGSTIVGSASRTRAHPSSGILTGQGALIVGTAHNAVLHPTSGALIGPGSSIVGAAKRFRAHTSSGILIGQGSIIVGISNRFHAHQSSGVLVGQGSILVGVAARGAPPSHDSSGALIGQGSIVVGSATHFRVHNSSGTLIGQGSVIVGAANNRPPLRVPSGIIFYTYPPHVGYALPPATAPLNAAGITMVFSVGFDKSISVAGLSLFITRSNGSSYYANPFLFYIGRTDLPSAQAPFLAGTYVVYTFASNELNMSGVWSAQISSGGLLSDKGPFRVI